MGCPTCGKLGLGVLSLPSIAREVLKGNFSSTSEYQKRVKICKACDSYNNVFQICNECLCIVRLKADLKNFSCPLKKW